MESTPVCDGTLSGVGFWWFSFVPGIVWRDGGATGELGVGGWETIVNYQECMKTHLFGSEEKRMTQVLEPHSPRLFLFPCFPHLVHQGNYQWCRSLFLFQYHEYIQRKPVGECSEGLQWITKERMESIPVFLWILNGETDDDRGFGRGLSELFGKDDGVLLGSQVTFTHFTTYLGARVSSCL